MTGRASTLRLFREGDVDALVLQANDPKVATNLRDAFPSPYTRSAAASWIAFSAAGGVGSPYHRAIEVSGVLAGAVGITVDDDIHRRSAEIGYWLGRSFWGRGIATEALRAMTAHAFATFDLCRLYAGVFETNLASARVLEKAGYVLEGRHRKAVTKHGVTMDELLYAIVR